MAHDNHDILERMANAVLEGDDAQAKLLAERALAEGIDPLDAINKGFVVGMTECGDKFSKQEYFVTNLLLSARAMKAGLEVLLPKVKTKGNLSSKGKVLIGTVEGDIHDIGKTVVKTMLETAGFEVLDLGVDVPSVNFIENVKKEKIDVLAMSCLLTSTMPEMEKVIKKLREEGLRDYVKVVVGGAPITNMFANKIGADAFGDNAKEAVDVVKGLIQTKDRR